MQGKESWRSENMKGDKEAKDILGNANERWTIEFEEAHERR